MIYAQHPVHQSDYSLRLFVGPVPVCPVHEIIVVVIEAFHRGFHCGGGRGHRIGSGTFIEHVPSPGVVSGGPYGLSRLDFSLYIAGIVLVLVDADVGILSVDRIVPVVVHALGEPAGVLVEHILGRLCVFEFWCIHNFSDKIYFHLVFESPGFFLSGVIGLSGTTGFAGSVDFSIAFSRASDEV